MSLGEKNVVVPYYTNVIYEMMIKINVGQRLKFEKGDIIKFGLSLEMWKYNHIKGWDLHSVYIKRIKSDEIEFDQYEDSKEIKHKTPQNPYLISFDD